MSFLPGCHLQDIQGGLLWATGIPSYFPKELRTFSQENPDPTHGPQLLSHTPYSVYTVFQPSLNYIQKFHLERHNIYRDVGKGLASVCREGDTAGVLNFGSEEHTVPLEKLNEPRNIQSIAILQTGGPLETPAISPLFLLKSQKRPPKLEGSIPLTPSPSSPPVQEFKITASGGGCQRPQ